MKSFKEPWSKAAIYSIIVTGFPYLLAIALVNWQHDSYGLAGIHFRFIVILGSPPLWVLTPVLPADNDTYFNYIYPLFNFTVWYCTFFTIFSIIHYMQRGVNEKKKK